MTKTCKNCGCTDEQSCPEGCYWVGKNMCSSCYPEQKKFEAEDISKKDTSCKKCMKELQKDDKNM